MMNAPSAALASSLPPPSHYETSLSYTEQWRQYRESSRSKGSLSNPSPKNIIFGLAFHNDAYCLWLAACTNSGEICLWKLPPPKQVREDDEQMTTTERFVSRKPVFRQKISNGTLYSIQIIDRRPDDRIVLVTSGDAGVLMFEWDMDIMNAVKQQQGVLSPCAQFQPYPNAREDSIEINDFVISGDHLYGAAGDAFGCYKWDLKTEKLVTTYKSPDRGYLHAVVQVPDTDLLLLGGEDSILSIWDCQKDKFVDQVDLKKNNNNNATTLHQSSQQRPYVAPQKRRKSKRSSSPQCISSIVARDENWWTVAGGRNDGGFLSTWHGPTRSLISCTDTRETPQQLALLQSEQRQHQVTLLSVANESFVSHWKNPLLLEEKTPQRVWCNSPSCYAVAVAPDGRVAVAGVGATVDIYEEATQLSMQLQI